MRSIRAEPQVWDETPDNLAFDWGIGDEAAVEPAMAARAIASSSSSSTTA